MDRINGKITYQQLTDTLDYDPDTGLFTWRDANAYGGSLRMQQMRPTGAVAGYIDGNGYRRITISPYGTFSAHRLAWLYETGKMPPRKHCIDHENRCRDDNRYENIRLATPTENSINAVGSSIKTNTLPKGVFNCTPRQHRSKQFRAQMKVGGKDVHIGYYFTPEEAEAAYLAFGKARYGDFVR